MTKSQCLVPTMPSEMKLKAGDGRSLRALGLLLLKLLVQCAYQLAMCTKFMCTSAMLIVGGGGGGGGEGGGGGGGGALHAE